ncbi:MFS transporter multidrug-resistance type transporter [Orobanche hederae]
MSVVERGDWLRKLQYGVFGLGNRQYEHFNKIATEVDKLVAEQGGQRLVPVGLGDDDQCIEDDFSEWRDLVCPELNKLFRGEDDATVSTSYAAAYRNTVLCSMTNQVTRSRIKARPIVTLMAMPFMMPSIPAAVNVAVTRELHAPASDRSCTHGIRHIRHCISLLANSELLAERSALIALAAYASDPSEANRLKHLASCTRKEEYSQYVVSGQRGLLEVMAEFPSANPLLGIFFAGVSPRVQPKFYSISSSPKIGPSRFHVACALVYEKTPTGRIHKGVCSTWMKERLALKESGAELGPAVLYFDYIYEDELNSFVKSGVISELVLAFSREGPTREYVQHKMAERVQNSFLQLPELNI